MDTLVSPLAPPVSLPDPAPPWAAEPLVPPPVVGLRRLWQRWMNYWRHLPLIQRLALWSLVPAAGLSMLLVLMLTTMHLSEIGQANAELAQSLTGQAAALLYAPLRDHDNATLNSMVASMRRGEVADIEVRDPDGRVLAQAHDLKAAPWLPVLEVHRPILAPNGADPAVGSLTLKMSLASVASSERQHLWISFVAILASLAAASGMAWWSARRVGTPIVTMAQALDKLGRGSYDVLVPVTDEAEIGALQRGFNAAATALLNTRHTMELSIEEALQALVQKNQALQQADRDKTRFLAAASHDLRQPLYALTLLCDGLVANPPNEASKEKLQMMGQCVASLDRLLRELLALTQIDSGVVKARMQAVAVAQVFAAVNSSFQVVAQRENLDLRVRRCRAVVYSDHSMLTRIVSNMVSNALRFTPSGGVLVGCRRRGRDLCIEVWDTGIGIEARHLPHLFEEFYRVQKSPKVGEAEGDSGFGLGLATVQRLARLIGAEVTVRSRPGRGSVFALHVPLWRYDEVHQGRRLPGSDLQGLRVVLIDDDMGSSIAIRLILEAWGCAVRLVQSGDPWPQALGDWDYLDLAIAARHLDDQLTGQQVLDSLVNHLDATSGHPVNLTITSSGLKSAVPFTRLIVTHTWDDDFARAMERQGIQTLCRPISPEQLRFAIQPH